MSKIILFMAYYGKLPNYFDIWLKAVEYNSTVNFCIITDCINQTKQLPSNVKLINLSFDDFKEKIQSKFNFKISINNYGRISQFRPALAYIFPEIVEGYNYWGFIECDLISGDIRAFITEDILKKYNKIFKLGHFQIFRNDKKMNTLFMQKVKSGLDYEFAFKKNILFFEEILGMQNIANELGCKTYSENVFADIKCYEYMFSRSQYGYEGITANNSCLCSYENGKTYCYTITNGILKKEEVLYIHLQKRAMKINTTNYNKYLIIPNTFDTFKIMNYSLFENIKLNTKANEEMYRADMKLKLDMSKKKRYKEFCWWQLKLKRMRIKRNGGIDLDGKD